MKDDLKTNTEESDISGNSTSMPSFDGMLSKEDIEAVAHYVSTSSSK